VSFACHIEYIMLIPVAVLSKAYMPWNARILEFTGLNPAQRMDVCPRFTVL